MASSVKVTLPPGFEEMSREEQVRYAQQLWDYVAPQPEELPVPKWQVDLGETRLKEYHADPNDVLTHDQVAQQVRERTRQRESHTRRNDGA